MGSVRQDATGKRSVPVIGVDPLPLSLAKNMTRSDLLWLLRHSRLPTCYIVVHGEDSFFSAVYAQHPEMSTKSSLGMNDSLQKQRL